MYHVSEYLLCNMRLIRFLAVKLIFYSTLFKMEVFGDRVFYLVCNLWRWCVQSALRELTSRDSFCAPEIDIFRAIQQWAERNPEHQVTTSAMATVRLPLIKLDDLLNVVRLSSLVSADAILDAIKLKTECKDMELNYRGFLSRCHFTLCK